MTVPPAVERKAIPSNIRPAIAKRDVAFTIVMCFFIFCSFNLGANAPCFLMLLLSWELTFWRQQLPCSFFNAEFPGQNHPETGKLCKTPVTSPDLSHTSDYRVTESQKPSKRSG